MAIGTTSRVAKTPWSRRLVRSAAITVLALAPAAVFAAAAAAGATSVPRFSAPVIVRLIEEADFSSIVAADLNGDGKSDLAITDASSTVTVLLGKGNGSFRKPTAYPSRSSGLVSDLVVGELNGDGMPDLVTAGKGISVLLNDGAGRFRRPTDYAAPGSNWALAVADVNRDGIVDVLTANLTNPELSVLLGQGGGQFAQARTVSGRGATDLVVGDVNGDGNPDVALASRHRSEVAVRLGAGDGTFGPAQSSVALTRKPSTLTSADVNHDGELDLVVGHGEGRDASVLLGNGDGTFTPASSVTLGPRPYFTLVADFNGDGNPDIAGSGPRTPGFAVASGRGDGGFARRQRFRWSTLDSGTVADFNGDGRPDLAFVDTNCVVCDVHGYEYDPSRSIVWLNWTGLPAPPCVPQNVIRKRLMVAKRALRASGCRPGHVRRRYSRKHRKGVVISQRPRHGAVLPSHGRVRLVVSRGRHH